LELTLFEIAAALDRFEVLLDEPASAIVVALASLRVNLANLNLLGVPVTNLVARSVLATPLSSVPVGRLWHGYRCRRARTPARRPDRWNAASRSDAASQSTLTVTGLHRQRSECGGGKADHPGAAVPGLALERKPAAERLHVPHDSGQPNAAPRRDGDSRACRNAGRAQDLEQVLARLAG